MIVISDTSVISNLLIIGELDLLQKLFQKILIPEAVNRELLALSKFGIDLSPYHQADWITVQVPEDTMLVQMLCDSLDQGESEAIALAKGTPDSLLAIDEKAGRKIAQSLGIEVIGLIGILIRAKEQGIIADIKTSLDRIIQEAGFYLTPQFYRQILKDQGE